MAADSHDERIQDRIANAIAVLSAIREPHAALRNLPLALEALRDAAAAIDACEAELDLVTAPDRDANAELAAARAELERAQRDLEAAELRTAAAERSRAIEDQVHADDKTRLQQLERKARDVDALLMQDDDAFSRYMDRAMDADEKRRGGPPTRE